MADSSERVIINFGDADLCDVCLVVGNTDFNVHKMVLASRSLYFKALFFDDSKEKNENRITIEAGPAAFQRMLELLYEGCCTNETNCPKCTPVFFELRQLMKRYAVQIRWKFFQCQNSFYKTCTNQNSDSPRVVVNFGDVELSDVCLVVGDTDFNVHKMVLARCSSYFKALFFRGFKEENDKRISMEADPALFQQLLEILYDGYCFSEKFFKCNEDFAEVMWEEGAPLMELLDYYDVKVGLKYFEDNLNKFCCSENYAWVSACSSCVLRKVFAMQHGIKLNASAFDSRAIQAAVKLAREKNIEIDNEVLTELIVSHMHHGAQL